MTGTATQLTYKYSRSLGIYSMVPGRGFNHPVDLALGDDGTIFVLDRGGSDTPVRINYKRVTRVTADEEYRGVFPIGNLPEGGTMWPVAIAIGPDGNLYISDEALHSIHIFSTDGAFLGAWGRQGSGDGQFDRPAGVAFDGEGNLVVADTLNGRIQRYTKEGRYLGGWAGPGSGDGELNMPWGVSVDASGSVYVADWGNDRVQKFDAAGRHLATYGSSGTGDGRFLRPSSVDTDEYGNIYVADWGNERVQVLGPDGGFIAELRGEATLSRWAEEYFSANLDELEERQKADMEPKVDFPPEDLARNQAASIEKYFWGPVSVKVDPQGRIYITETCRHRIQIYQRV